MQTGQITQEGSHRGPFNPGHDWGYSVSCCIPSCAMDDDRRNHQLPQWKNPEWASSSRVVQNYVAGRVCLNERVDRQHNFVFRDTSTVFGQESGGQLGVDSGMGIQFHGLPSDDSSALQGPHESVHEPVRGL